MNLKRNLVVAILMTVVTTIVFGLVYPLVVTGLAQVLFHDKANGQLIEANGKIIGSRIRSSRRAIWTGTRPAQNRGTSGSRCR